MIEINTSTKYDYTIFDNGGKKINKDGSAVRAIHKVFHSNNSFELYQNATHNTYSDLIITDGSSIK